MPNTMAERLTETRRRLIMDMMKEAKGQISDISIGSILETLHSPSTDIKQVRADMDFFVRHGLAETIEAVKAGIFGVKAA